MEQEERDIEGEPGDRAQDSDAGGRGEASGANEPREVPPGAGAERERRAGKEGGDHRDPGGEKDSPHIGQVAALLR